MGLVFITAGLAYAFAGYKAKVSKYLRGDPGVQFDLKRIGKTAGLGVFLGLIAFGTEELLNGDGVFIDITDPGVFAKQVAATMGIIYGVDKLIIAGTDGGSRKTARKDPPAADTPAIDAEFETLDKDQGPAGALP